MSNLIGDLPTYRVVFRTHEESALRALFERLVMDGTYIPHRSNSPDGIVIGSPDWFGRDPEFPNRYKSEQVQGAWIGFRAAYLIRGAL